MYIVPEVTKFFLSDVGRDPLPLCENCLFKKVIVFYSAFNTICCGDMPSNSVPLYFEATQIA